MSPRPRHQFAYKDNGKSVGNQTLRIKNHFTTGALVAVMVTHCLVQRMRWCIYAGFHYRFSTVVGKDMGTKIGELAVATQLRRAESATAQPR